MAGAGDYEIDEFADLRDIELNPFGKDVRLELVFVGEVDDHPGCRMIDKRMRLSSRSMHEIPQEREGGDPRGVSRRDGRR